MGNIEAAVRPTIGTNIQPTDSGSMVPSGQGGTFGDLLKAMTPPSPGPQAQAPMPESMGALLGGGGQPAPQTPPAAPPPQSQYLQNRDGEQKTVDSLYDSIKTNLGGAQKEAFDGDTKKELDSLYDSIKSDLGDHPAPVAQFNDKAPIVDRPAPGQSFPSYAVKSVVENLKFLGAKNRANLGENFEKQKIAWQSMYGDDNVEVKNKQIYIRPNGTGQFRRVDQTQFNFIADFVAHNVLNAGPVLANAMTQGAVDAAAVAGAPETGGLSLPMAATSAALGGAAGAMAREGLQNSLDMVSSKPQIDKANPGKEIAGLSSQILKEMGWNMAGRAIIGVGASAADSEIGRGSIKKIQDIIGSIPGMQVDKVSAGVSSMEKAAAARLAVKDFADSLAPGVYGPKVMGRQMEAPVGRQTYDAVAATGDRMGKTIELVQNKAIELAKEKGQVAAPETLVQKMEEILSDHDITINSAAADFGYGGGGPKQAVIPSEGHRFALGSKDGLRDLQGIAHDYNQIQRSLFTKQGVDPEELGAIIQKYQGMADYASDVPSSGRANQVFKDLRSAGATDRNNFFAQVFKDSGAPEEKIFNDSYLKYSRDIEDIRAFKQMFRSEGQKSLMVENLWNNASQAQRLDTFNNLKRVLGEQSPEWNMFRGEIVNNMISESVNAKGILDAGSLLNRMKAVHPEIMDSLLSKTEQGQLKLIANNAHDVAMADANLSAHQQKIVDTTVGMLSKLRTVKAVQTFYQMFGGNAAAMKYALDDGYLEAARQAISKGEQSRILEQMRYLDELVYRMKPVSVARESSKGGKSMVKVFLPIARAELSQNLSTRGAQTPQPMPPPAPAPSMQDQSQVQ